MGGEGQGLGARSVVDSTVHGAWHDGQRPSADDEPFNHWMGCMNLARVKILKRFR